MGVSGDQNAGSSSSQPSDSVQSIEDQIQKLHTILAVSTENGLFSKDQKGNEELFTRAKQSLHDAYTDLQKKPPDSPDIASSLNHIQDFYQALSQAEDNAGTWWKASNLYAVPAWIYLTLAPLIVYLSAVYFAPKFMATTLVQAAVWGMLGACLQGLYYCYQQTSTLSYQRQWIFWILALPPGGLIFGGVAYLLLVGGVVPAVASTATATNIYFVFLFSALSGFSWKSVVAVMNGFWSRLGSQSKQG